MAVETRLSAFQTAQQRFGAAAEVIGLSDDARIGLREVKRELTVHFPVRMDDGGVHVFTGWRVQHNISRGPAKGASAGSARWSSQSSNCRPSPPSTWSCGR